MAKRYSEGTVRYRVRRGKDGVERGHWEALLKVSDDDGPWKSKSKAIKNYPKQTADGRTTRTEILSPTKSRPNQGREGALAALAEWREQLMVDDEVAERKARQAELGAGDATILSVTPDSTVYEYVDAFVSSRKIKSANNPAGIARSTYDGYRYAIRSMDRGFGGTRLRDLTPARILAWQKSLERQGKAGATINRAYWCLKNACEYAVQNGDMDAEQFALCFPRKRVDAPKSANPDPNPLDDSSLDLLNLLIDRANAGGDPSAFMVCVELALLTGMRQSEVCGLRWRDVDLEGSGQYPTGSIHVCNVLSRSGSEFVQKEPKTKAGNRFIPLNADLRGLLLARREQQAREMAEAGADLSDTGGRPPLDYHVCGNANGGFFNPTVLSRSWRSFAQGNDLRGIKGRRVVFHDLRHTFATRAIHEGVDVEVVSKILGHAKVSITVDIYADAMPDAKKRGMEAMNGVVRRHEAHL
ncbi:tyrosine-type recombinase/integrase [Olsenella sp. Marseille-P4559]|uniref:tyrosine-type recombinase/integrase n=1 Tax=Olsenella sp. Marseille-P4559 TaxID=2364795 RepID=UPI00102F6149|nr:tyrosine-type recombinase/integrase [Olsenella sp. Marseille-P4559]